MRTKTKIVRGGSQTRLKQHNIGEVINRIRLDGPITKKEVVTKTGLSFAKVNSITKDLLALKLITESGKAESSGGRPSAIYQINPKYGCIIACELSHKKISTIVMDLNAKIVSKHSVGFDVKAGRDSMLEKVISCIRTEINNLKFPREKIVGIGIAVAGLVDPSTGLSTPFPHLVDWGEIELKEIIENEFDLYCHIENVANAAALAEYNFGVKKVSDNILALNVGSGLGMGIILDGRLYKGITGSAGELGHITVDENGPLCTCGNVGCLETLASTNAIVMNARKMLQRQVSSSLNNVTENDTSKVNFKLICEAAFQGDKLSFNLLDEMGRNLGEGIVTLINLFNPKMIIVGGEVCYAKDIILQPLLNVVHRRALEIPRKVTEIVFSNIGSDAGIIGVTVPVMERYFSKLPDKIAVQIQ